MKNFLLATVLTAAAAALLQYFLPWWSVAIAAAVVGFLYNEGKFAAFTSGFIGIFVLWTVHAFSISLANHHILAEKIAQLFPLGGHGSLVILITGIVGGLVGGLAALSGNLYRR